MKIFFGLFSTFPVQKITRTRILEFLNSYFLSVFGGVLLILYCYSSHIMLIECINFKTTSFYYVQYLLINDIQINKNIQINLMQISTIVKLRTWGNANKCIYMYLNISLIKFHCKLIICSPHC